MRLCACTGGERQIAAFAAAMQLSTRERQTFETALRARFLATPSTPVLPPPAAAYAAPSPHDEWEPDEDFFVQLFHVVDGKGTDDKLTGKDSITKITIIDDDKPGMIVFKEKDTIKAPATKEYAEIVIERIKGSDGRLTVEFETVTMDDGAGDGVDFRS